MVHDSKEAGLLNEPKWTLNGRYIGWIWIDVFNAKTHISNKTVEGKCIHYYNSSRHDDCTGSMVKSRSSVGRPCILWSSAWEANQSRSQRNNKHCQYFVPTFHVDQGLSNFPFGSITGLARCVESPCEVMSAGKAFLNACVVSKKSEKKYACCHAASASCLSSFGQWWPR